MKFNLKLMDGTFLNQVILTTTKEDMSIGEFKNREDFYNYIDSENSKVIYFCGRYVQGGISHPKVIVDYDIFEDDECTCTLICNCGKTYNYVPEKCDRCGNVFVDC